MSEWSRFQSQFYETDWERRERWRKTKDKRAAEGRCWQCGDAIEKCMCPNITHPKAEGRTAT
jgi:DTW domain-containing protein YfiP